MYDIRVPKGFNLTPISRNLALYRNDETKHYKKNGEIIILLQTHRGKNVFNGLLFLPLSTSLWRI